MWDSSKSLTTRPLSQVAVHASQQICSMLGLSLNAPASVVLNSLSNAIAVFRLIDTVYASLELAGVICSLMSDPSMLSARCFRNRTIYRKGYAGG